MAEQLLGVGAQAAAIEGGENAALAAELGVVQGCVGLVAVEMQRAAAAKIERRHRMQVAVIAATQDRALAIVRHDEGQRRFLDLAPMHRQRVLRCHVEEHAREPVVGERGQEIGRNPKLGTAECCRNRVAAEADGVVLRHGLLVAGREMVGQEGPVDVGLADEERLHAGSCNPGCVPIGRFSISATD
jgi:hypothetical protein